MPTAKLLLQESGKYCYAADSVPIEKEPQPTNYELSPLAAVLARRFIQRWDCYPQQTGDGTSYFTVHESLNVDILFAHLRGEVTLGTYLLNEKSRGRFLVLDADDAQQWQQLIDLAERLAEQNTPTYLEKSRRGGHLWFFFDHWLPGEQIRPFAKGVLAANEIQGIEIYPKQDSLGKGPGSLVRLPFGLHRKSQKRYGFIYPDGTPLAATVGEQLRMLSSPYTVPKTVLTKFVTYWEVQEEKRRKTAVTLPLNTHHEVKGDAPLSERIKAAVSIQEFIGQFVELSSSGQGLCPFHDDHHPSFSVNEEENYWYCFACDKGGSIIDFWMMKQGCDFQTAIRQLSEELFRR